MILEALDPELLDVHADAYARELGRTMKASREATPAGPARHGSVGRIRHWIGTRLVRTGEALASEPCGPVQRVSPTASR